MDILCEVNWSTVKHGDTLNRLQLDKPPKKVWLLQKISHDTILGMEYCDDTYEGNPSLFKLESITSTTQTESN